jgi:hypothetical protein
VATVITVASSHRPSSPHRDEVPPGRHPPAHHPRHQAAHRGPAVGGGGHHQGGHQRTDQADDIPRGRLTEVDRGAIQGQRDPPRPGEAVGEDGEGGGATNHGRPLRIYGALAGGQADLVDEGRHQHPDQRHQQDHRQAAGHRRLVLCGNACDGVGGHRTEVDGSDEEPSTERQHGPEAGTHLAQDREDQSGQDERVDDQAGAEGVEPAHQRPPGVAPEDMVHVMGDAERQRQNDEDVQRRGHRSRRTLFRARPRGASHRYLLRSCRTTDGSELDRRPGASAPDAFKPGEPGRAGCWRCGSCSETARRPCQGRPPCEAAALSVGQSSAERRADELGSSRPRGPVLARDEMVLLGRATMPRSTCLRGWRARLPGPAAAPGTQVRTHHGHPQ